MFGGIHAAIWHNITSLTVIIKCLSLEFGLLLKYLPCVTSYAVIIFCLATGRFIFNWHLSIISSLPRLAQVIF